MAKTPKSRSGDYKVGRGCPPEHTRFKPGQSGNPSGRRKGSVNLATLVRKVAAMEIPVNEGGEERHVPLLEGIILRQAQEAIRGDARAAQTFLALCQQHLPAEDIDGSEDMPAEDQAILRRFLRQASEGSKDD